MKFDPLVWSKLLSPIGIDDFPKLGCPTCGQLRLTLNVKDLRFQRLKNQYEGRRFEHEDFGSSVLLKILGAVAFATEEAMWEQCRFNGHLVCDSCGEITSILGKAKLPNSLAKSNNIRLDPQLMPEYFSPAVPIIPLHAEYPLVLREELGKSFALFFSDTSSAGNRVRACLEFFLDEQGIDRFERDSDGKVKTTNRSREVTLSLGKRINEYGKKSPDFAEMLAAIKLVGNEGSHGSGLNREALLAAYKIIDYVLTSTYVHSRTHTEMLQISNELKLKYS